MDANYLTGCTEIRKLPRQYISELGNILQIGHAWRDLMGLVPGNPWVPGQKLPEVSTYQRKYTTDDICLVAAECSRDGRTGFEVLIEEWGTSGRKRPKISDLINLLDRAGLERSSAFLKNIIKDYSETKMVLSGLIEETQTLKINDANSTLDSAEIDDSEVIAQLANYDMRIPYSEVEAAIKKGTSIGSGAFGIVYKAMIYQANEPKIVAIKLLCDSDDCSKLPIKKETLFVNEVKILFECMHKNIIHLEAYSCRKSDFALIYSFMENGSLFDRISCIDNTPPLPWKLRIQIAEGTAEGITYLHTKFSPPLVHRDIKTPNILLDGNFTPKLGDFGIVRAGSRGVNTGTAVNTTAIGTQMYMAPEAFRGDVSVKMDTFSYGIVILELLTGLLYFDEERENSDILSHVQEMEEDNLSLLDASAGDWNIEIAKQLFDFAELCTRDKRDRPDMLHALSLLKDISKDI